MSVFIGTREAGKVRLYLTDPAGITLTDREAYELALRLIAHTSLTLPSATRASLREKILQISS